MSTPAAERLKAAREKKYATAKAAADALSGVSHYTYVQHESGIRNYGPDSAERYARLFGTTPEWLMFGRGAATGTDVLVPIRGFVGADPSGLIAFADGQESGDLAPAPPGGGNVSVVEVRGHSMKGFADDGSLIYYENLRSQPDRHMLGEVVIVQTKGGEVLVKRLLKGSRPGVWDLESIAGPTLEDVEIEWVAEIAYIMPPLRARKKIVRSQSAA